MEKKKKQILTGALLAGAVIGTAGLAANTNSLFEYDDLGTGSEIRTTLATQSISDDAGVYSLEMKCGEDTKKAKTKKDESKTKDAKCGEGKCGTDGKDKKTEDTKATKAKTEDKKAESKTKDAKCGEGKCGM